MAKRQQVPRETIDQGTKQTRERLRPDPINELAAAWKRSHEPGAAEMESAAREIRRCYQMVSRAVMARIGNLDGTPAGSSASPAADRLVIAYNDRYKPWADAMGKSGVLPIVNRLAARGAHARTDRPRPQNTQRHSVDTHPPSPLANTASSPGGSGGAKLLTCGEPEGRFAISTRNP
jgi:hypothetical protein